MLRPIPVISCYVHGNIHRSKNLDLKDEWVLSQSSLLVLRISSDAVLDSHLLVCFSFGSALPREVQLSHSAGKRSDIVLQCSSLPAAVIRHAGQWHCGEGRAHSSLCLGRSSSQREIRQTPVEVETQTTEGCCLPTFSLIHAQLTFFCSADPPT